MAEKEMTEVDLDFADHVERRSCYNVMSLDHNKRCNYVQTTPKCTDSMSFVNYIKIMECDMHAGEFGEIIALIIMICFVFYYVTILAIVADKYFGPALKYISVMLHMNEHLAGVTLLAFGNSAADLVANIGNIGDVGPMHASSLSAAVFITMISGGLVCYICPFKMNANATLRDVLFFIAGVLLLEYTIKNNGKVSRLEAASFLLFYLVYIIVNGIEIYLNNKAFTKEEEEIKRLELSQSDPIEVMQLEQKLDEKRRASRMQSLHRKSSRSSEEHRRKQSKFSYVSYTSIKHEVVDEDATRNVFYNRDNPKNKDLFIEFGRSLNPIDLESWQEATKGLRMFMVIAAPIRFLTHLYIPCVDKEEDKHGWSKLLNCMQIIISPALLLAITQSIYLLYTFTVTVPTAIIVFFTSRTDQPPKYHWIFTLIACFNCMTCIYIVATEIETLITLIGMVANLSEDFLGATVSVWGSSAGDLVANVVVAMQGYGGMAFAAAYGGPFFVTIISAGIVYTYESWASETGEFEIEHGEYGLNSFVFLMLALSSTLIWSSTLNFQTRRSIGIFNIGLYAVYVIIAILCEKEVIHNFADDEAIEIL